MATVGGASPTGRAGRLFGSRDGGVIAATNSGAVRGPRFALWIVWRISSAMWAFRLRLVRLRLSDLHHDLLRPGGGRLQHDELQVCDRKREIRVQRCQQRISESEYDLCR